MSCFVLRKVAGIGVLEAVHLPATKKENLNM